MAGESVEEEVLRDPRVGEQHLERNVFRRATQVRISRFDLRRVALLEGLHRDELPINGAQANAIDDRDEDAVARARTGDEVRGAIDRSGRAGTLLVESLALSEGRGAVPGAPDVETALDLPVALVVSEAHDRELRVHVEAGEALV